MRNECPFDTPWIDVLNRKIDIILSYMDPGGRLNKKDSLTRYGDSHVKDETS